MKEQVLTGIDGKRVVIQTPENAEDLQKLYRAGTPGPVAFFLRDEAEAHDERWVTIKKSEEGKGRKLLLSDDGKILGGDVPKTSQGKSLKEAFTALKSKVVSPPSQKETSPKETSELLKEIPGETAEEYLDRIFASHGLTPEGRKMKTQASPAKIVEEAQIQQMNKKLRVAMFGKDLDDPRDVTQKQREEAKAQIANTLASRLQDNEDFIHALHKEAEELGYTPSNDPTIVAKKVSALISGWATTSADNNAKALAMQRAAMELFGLTEAKTEHFPEFVSRKTYEDAKKKLAELGKASEEIRDISDEDWNNLSAEQQKDYAKENKRLGDEYRSALAAFTYLEERFRKTNADAEGAEQTEKAYKAFLKAQYDETQAYFKKHGITHLMLYRGMGGVPLPKALPELSAARQKLEGLRTSVAELQEGIKNSNAELAQLKNTVLHELRSSFTAEQLQTISPARLDSLVKEATALLEASPAYQKKQKEHSELEQKYAEVFSSYKKQSAIVDNFVYSSEADCALQPISSFSTSYRTARSFGAGNNTQTVIACVVPVEQILSTAKTGFGCLFEGEVTVLAHQLKGKRVTVPRMGDLPRTAEEFHQVIGKLV